MRVLRRKPAAGHVRRAVRSSSSSSACSVNRSASPLVFVVVAVIVVALCPQEATCQSISIDDLIGRALSLVRPLLDGPQPTANGPSISSPFRAVNRNDQDQRGRTILGTPDRTSSAEQLPLCNGNSKLCQFISCTANNFKHDQNLQNLNLAATVIGDPIMRKAISSDPETITTLCREQGMDEAQCSIFSNGFVLIDKFASAIEVRQETTASSDVEKSPHHSVRANGQKLHNVRPGNDESDENDGADDDSSLIAVIVKSSSPATPLAPFLLPLNDEGNAPSSGSRTWSSRKANTPRPLEFAGGDLISNLTPIPGLPSFPTFVSTTTPSAPKFRPIVPLAPPRLPQDLLPFSSPHRGEIQIRIPPVISRPLAEIEHFVRPLSPIQIPSIFGGRPGNAVSEHDDSWLRHKRVRREIEDNASAAVYTDGNNDGDEEEERIRVKRADDYYDQVDPSTRQRHNPPKQDDPTKPSVSGGVAGGFGSILSSPVNNIKNCMDILG